MASGYRTAETPQPSRGSVGGAAAGDEPSASTIVDRLGLETLMACDAPATSLRLARRRAPPGRRSATGNVAVLVPEHEPRRKGLPRRGRAGQTFGEGGLGDGTLGGAHLASCRRRDIGGELVVEHISADRELGAAVGQRVGVEGVSQGAAREACRELQCALARVGREGRHVDRPVTAGLSAAASVMTMPP